MTRRVIVHGILATVGLVWLATAAGVRAQDRPPASAPGAWPGVPKGMSPGAGAYGTGLDTAQLPKPMVLTEDQLKGFLAAVTDLRGLDTGEAAGWAGADPSQPKSFGTALQLSGEAQTILRKHGFSDASEFQRVGYNAAMAYSVLEQGGKKALDDKLKKAERQQAQALEKMRQHMSPEQLKMLEGHMGAGMKMAGTMQDVPEENIALVTKYRDEWKNLGD